MIKRVSWTGAVFLAIAVVSFASVTQAATTVLNVELGETFTGNIETAGEDQVDAQFNAVQGTAVRVTARAMEGSTLQPTIVIKDGTGAPMGQVVTLSLEWLPMPNVLAFFTAPASGSYTAEIGGISGAGEFTGSVLGDLPQNVQLTEVSGTVVNTLTGGGIAGATVLIGPFLVVTDADGNYSIDLPVGDYEVSVEAANFNAATQALAVRPGPPLVADVSLMPAVPVMVAAGSSGSAAPGGAVTTTVSVTPMDGSTVQTITWSQELGVTAVIDATDPSAAVVTLGALADYKDELIHVLSEPPVTQAQLPPTVVIPEGEFPGGLQDRFQVVGANPFALEEAALVVLEVEVTTTSGTYHDEVEIHAALPWGWTAGIQNVAIGLPVLLHGKDQSFYDWALTVPISSATAFIDATTDTPWFTPDVPGVYEVVVTDEATMNPVTLEIFAGHWRGVIVGQNAQGRPISDPACTNCHGSFAPDKFTPWEETGHAEIFEDNLNTSTHYGPNCFPCHTVGYDTGAANNGFEDAADYPDFLGAGLINNPGDNWTTVLSDFPEAAQLANIQCENCHGPQDLDAGEDSDAHGLFEPDGAPRTSLSSDVCAVCHGEPLRHARFQQWQLSGHANYELAIDEGDRGSCSRCHTANGFLEWLPILLDDDPATDPLEDITVNWEIDETHPQTCVTCHDPHAIGTTTGIGTNATVRISGDTPLLTAGFIATEVGRGAICMTCHNSRRGLRNDGNFDPSDASRVPHGSAQTDVVMGENAYLINVGVRGGHSFIEDTCVKCHMEATPPPAVLSYNQGGSNHTFFARPEICSECHTGINVEGVQGGVENLLDVVEVGIEAAWLELMGDLIDAGNTIELGGAVIDDVADVAEIQFTESRGRQAMIVTLADETVVGPVSVTSVDVVNGASVVIGDFFDFIDAGVAKAAWNWVLIHNDGSRGVHNPPFAIAALSAARAQLPALPPTKSRSRKRQAEGTSFRDSLPRPSRPGR